jgi:hypothetical protein
MADGLEEQIYRLIPCAGTNGISFMQIKQRLDLFNRNQILDVLYKLEAEGKIVWKTRANKVFWYRKL